MPAQKSDEPYAPDRPTARRARAMILIRRCWWVSLLALLAVYVTTLQTHISGSFNPDRPGGYLKNEYIKDVGEIQVALNVWGTIHHTGYPLFAILGNLFTAPLRVLDVEPAYAASLYALAWGLVALGGFGLLIWRLTGRLALAAISVTLLGLARSIWIHNVIAEVYSMSLAITVLMLVIALWPVPWAGAWSARRRVWWLALLGGIGVSHHRAVVFVAPGLILSVVPHLWADRARWRGTLLVAAGLAMIGFVPYIYLPLREWHGGEWVYGEPGSWDGFWTEFTGREADRLVALPDGAAGWVDNVRAVWNILVDEITLPGLLIGIGGLALAMIILPHRRAAQVVGLCAAGPALFAIAYHTAVLPEAILMPTVMGLVFGVALLVDALARAEARRIFPVVAALGLIGMVGWSAALIGVHHAYIRELVTEPTGLETIERVTRVPREGQPALMLPWGPRYAAASYSRLVTGENADVMVVDHKANYRRLLADGYRLYTDPETFYTYPLPWPNALPVTPSEWWTERLGQFFLTSAAPGIVELVGGMPDIADPNEPDGTPIVYDIMRRDTWLTCDAESVYLTVIWQANQKPERSPSIFVHLTGDEPGPPLAQDDKVFPVYGLYPFTAWWGPAQLVRDDFTLPRLPGGTQVRFGLYEQDAGGVFHNYGEIALPVAGCQPVPWRDR